MKGINCPLDNLSEIPATAASQQNAPTIMSFDPDDVWADAIKGIKHLPQLQKRRLYRVALVGVIGISYLIDTCLLSLFVLAGTISAKAPLYYGLAGLGHVLLFSAFHWSGFSERFANRHMTLWGMAYGIGAQLLGILLAPQITPFFLALVFVVFAFGTLRISFREALVIWFLCILAIAVTISLKGESQLTLMHASRFEYLLVTISFALILLRAIALGYYGQMLRQRLFELGRSFENDATHDALTGSYNRRVLQTMIEEQHSLLRRKGIPCAFAMIDIDHFKRINDTFGHATGDEILRILVTRIRQEIRESDKLIRYGGEEFVLIMAATELEEARVLSERIRQQIAQHAWDNLPADQRMTISIGLTPLRESDQADDTIQRADIALYAAKHTGRNRVVIQREGEMNDIPPIIMNP
jgi:diguanylate cyclase